MSKNESITDIANRIRKIEERLEKLKDLHATVTGRRKKFGKDELEPIPEKVTFKASFREIDGTIDELCPDIAERLAAMIEAEEARIYEERVEFVRLVNAVWGDLAPPPPILMEQGKLTQVGQRPMRLED